MDIICHIIGNIIWLILKIIESSMLLLQVMWSGFCLYLMLSVLVFIFQNILFFFIAVVIYPGIITMIGSFASNAFMVVGARNRGN